jgi:signal transduction histidine kinase
LILDLQGTSDGSAPPPPLSPQEVERSICLGLEESLRLNDRRADTTLEIEACSILARASELSHIVEELTDNAYKFSRKGTPVKVKLQAGKLTVMDRGRGLTAEEIERVGAFQQFDRKKHEQQGLGLGLVLVQKIALASGAKFSITSRYGDETQVQIIFSPANQA